MKVKYSVEKVSITPIRSLMYYLMDSMPLNKKDLIYTVSDFILQCYLLSTWETTPTEVQNQKFYIH